MDYYNARVELEVRYPTDEGDAEDLADEVMEVLAAYGGAVARAPHGRVELIFTVPADSLRQATSTAIAVAEAASSWGVFAVEVMPTEEFHRRSEEETVPPPLLSVTGTAELLGVSRARVQQLIDAGQLAAVKVGTVWVVVRSSAEARLSEHRPLTYM